MGRPVIGITPNYEEDERIGIVTDLGTSGQDWNYIAGDYTSMIEKAGGIPVILPIADTQYIDDVLDSIDGLLISGGSDVGPELYHEFPIPELGKVNTRRDMYEVALIRRAFERDIPMLGICRGIQMINVALGGTLYQDVVKQLNVLPHSTPHYPRNTGWHEVHFTEGSMAEKIFGKSSIMTNSYHHQSVKKACNGSVITGKTSDGIVEVLEFPEKRFAVAVQWHPEMMYDSAEQLLLSEAFIKSCK